MEAEPPPQDDSESFLETPAIKIAARSLAAEKAALVGQLVGPYRILEFLGAGGMGEVFLAEDIRLGRRAALKLLPAVFASDPNRISRFEQEARAASALNHPNVLVVYDAGVHNGLPYIGSEYLEGEALRDRLNGSPLPLRKAIDFAIQMARALAAAHESGIIHRDLKPENLFITREERIKVLDFGLAKLTHPGSVSGSGALGGSNSASLPSTPGVVMGTVGYSSPEQLQGLPADARSDIFAFGAILYEMLTGRRAFPGPTAGDVMRATLSGEPADWGSSPAVPPALTRIVDRCQEKLPSERFQSARDLAFTLEALSSSSSAQSLVLPPQHRSTIFRKPLAWIIAGILFLSAIALAALFLRKPREMDLVRFEMGLPGGDPFVGGPAVALSPDGKYLALLSTGPNSSDGMLWLRAMDNPAPRPVPGSEGARYPFFSPDSRFLAFQADNKLETLDLASGSLRTICRLSGIVNGAWNTGNVILISTGTGPLLRVAASGAPAAVPATVLDSSHGQRGHWWPYFLPDNRHFLYTVRSATTEESGLYIGSLENSETKLLLTGAISNAAFVSPGYLLYAREGNLMARAFNPSRLEFKGEEIPIADQLKTYYGYAVFSVSQTGMLVYRTGSQAHYQLTWFDRAGRNVTPAESPAGRKWREGVLPLSPTLSPDGKLLAIVQYRAPKGSYDIWIVDLSRGNVAFPLTNTSNAEFPVWSPDGTQVAYSASPKGGARDLFVKRIDGAAGQLVFHSDADKWPLDWSADRNTLLFSTSDAHGHFGLWAVPLGGTAAPISVLEPSIDVNDASLSPDGRWVSYSSRRSGDDEIYLQDFPTGRSRIVVSTAGGRYPRWRRDGKELFYLAPDDELMSVEIQPGPTRSVGLPRPLFKTGAVGTHPYTVSPDGRRFLMQTRFEDSAASPLTFVLNWTKMLK